jgi:hypothetical protein
MLATKQDSVLFKTAAELPRIQGVLTRALQWSSKCNKLSIAQSAQFWNTIVKLFEAPCISSGSGLEPQLSHVKLGAFCYIMAVQNIVRVHRINLHTLPKL